MAVTVRRRLRVHGRVQGVFFRNWTVARAKALGLSGWVRNRSDGSVEILACGTAEAVSALEALCGRGPPAAEVDRVAAEPAEEHCPEGFAKRPTA